jgi:16S rRNA (guanine527-N7)-methyltransferase
MYVGMERLLAGSSDIGITLSSKHMEALEKYHNELIEWNQRFNLTAITDREGVAVRHFLDSLSCLAAISRSELSAGARVIDVGTGAGFPGLPLKIVCPDMCLTLLEATGKKVSFLEHIVSVLGLKHVTIVKSRAEEVGHDPKHRERYDWAVARAVAEMPTLAEYMLPLIRVGGSALAQKGEMAAAEVHRAETAIKTLGGQVRRLIPIELHGLTETRHLVILDKIAATPEKYPRRPGIPRKRPL